VTSSRCSRARNRRSLAGRYKIIEEVGQGGMGRVYKVLDTEIQEKMGMKLLRPEIAQDSQTIERFTYFWALLGLSAGFRAFSAGLNSI